MNKIDTAKSIFLSNIFLPYEPMLWYEYEKYGIVLYVCSRFVHKNLIFSVPINICIVLY